jgi:predicted enzyme related to lactoylglutathione lyase
VSLRVEIVTFDCSDPAALADFWIKATGGAIAASMPGFVLIDATAAGIPHMGFQSVPEPKQTKNRMHVDFRTAERTAEVERLVALGATVVEEHQIPGFAWTVLQDPEGNEFCVGG